MNVTKSIVQVEQKRRIRISKNAIFTNGIFLFNIKITKYENDYT